MTRLRGLSLLLVGVAVAACSAGTPGDLSASASKVLSAQVQQVRELAATGTFAQLRAAVTNLKSLVRQQADEGEVSASRAAAIQDAADALLQDARALRPTPSPTVTTTSPTPTPTITSESPTPTPTPTETVSPTPTDTSSPLVSTSVGTGGNGGGGGGDH